MMWPGNSRGRKSLSTGITLLMLLHATQCKLICTLPYVKGIFCHDSRPQKKDTKRKPTMAAALYYLGFFADVTYIF